MSFKVQPIAGEKWELVFTDEPDFVHALRMAPESLEPESSRGTWLIVAFAIWSGPDRLSVQAAIACAKHHAGRFNLGVRPYDYFEENAKWWPGPEARTGGNVLLDVKGESPHLEIHITQDPTTSPLWLILQDGQVIHQKAGRLAKVEVFEMMRDILAR